MEIESPILDIAKMSKVQKLAALMIILGPESAAQMMKNLDEHEVEAVSLEMSKLNIISQELQREILREFTDVAVQASTGVLGGVSFTKTVLEKSVGLFRASDIIGRVAPARVPLAAMQQIIDMEVRQIFNLLKQEQPQTIALILSYLPSEKSGQVLVLLRGELRDKVVERLATLTPTPLEVVERIVEILNQKAGVKPTRALSQTGGIKNAAELLNTLDKNISQSMLLDLEQRNPELGRAIRQKMFTFEELSLLDAQSLQKIMREVDMRDLAVSLKTASPKLKGALLGAISKRAAETVNEEISFLGPLKKKDIEAAQMRIIDSVRQLESEGELEPLAAQQAVHAMNTWSETIIMSKPLRDVRLAGRQLASECPTVTGQGDIPQKVRPPENEDQLHAAYDRGRVDGEKSVNEQLIKQRTETNELFRGVLTSLSQAVPQVVRDTENMLVSLALEVAQKLVADMPISAQIVEAAIQDALGQVEGTAQVTIRLHPADLEMLQNSNSSMLEQGQGATEFRFLGSPEVSRGGCLVQTRFGVVDARRETKFDLLKRNLLP